MLSSEYAQAGIPIAKQTRKPAMNCHDYCVRTSVLEDVLTKRAHLFRNATAKSTLIRGDVPLSM